MITSRNNRFFKGGFSGLMIAAAILCGAFAAQAAGALPAGYTEVPYLQSHATVSGSSTTSANAGYVITDVFVDPSQDTIDAVIKIGSSVSSKTIWVVRGSNHVDRTLTLIYGYNGGNTVRFDYNDTSTQISKANYFPGDVVSVSLAGNVCTLTKRGAAAETLQYTKDNTFTSTGGPLMFFALGNYSSGSYSFIDGYYSNGRLYSFTITRGGVVIHDLVPAMRDSDSKLGLYDNVSGGKFYPGTGCLTSSTAPHAPAGQMPTGYTEVEYIQGDGLDARILTDYVPTPNYDKIEAVVEFPDNSFANASSHTVWCARNNGTTKTWSAFVVYNKYRFDYASTQSDYLTPTLATGVKYTITADGPAFSSSGQNGQTHGQTHGKAADFVPDNPLALFCSYVDDTETTLTNYGKQKLYSFKVWRSEDLIHYFVPCKNPAGVAVMVDLCANPAELDVLGNFTAGPEGHFYDDLLFTNFIILPIPEQKCSLDATPQPGFTITNTATGANWTFAQGGVAPGGCPFDATYSRAGDVGTVTATGKAGGDYAGMTVSRSYSVSSELLVNGDFETGVNSPWTGGSTGDSSSPYSPNLHTTFISGTYCGIIQRPSSKSQVFTNDAPCFARLSWKCKRRTNNNCAVYYTVTIDGNVVWPEEKFTGNEIWYRKVDNIKLSAGEHTLVFQVRTDNNEDSTLFIDNVSLQNVGTSVKELLVNGDFELGKNDPWTGGHINAATGGYEPNYDTTFVSGSYCAVIQMSENKTQVFTNSAPYIATLSWKYKHRTNFFAENPMYYTVTIDGKTVWGEEKVTGSTVLYKQVEGIKLKPGVHMLVFQGRTDNNQDSSLFLDDVSLWVTGRIPGLMVVVH